MKKLLLAILLNILPWGEAWWGHATTLFGCMNFSSADEWTMGMYAFQDDGSGSFTCVNSGVDNSMALNGGAYGAGKYLCYQVTGSYINYNLTFRILNPANNSWDEEKSVAVGNNYKYVPSDMTYDYRTDKFFAVCFKSYESSEGGYLCEVNPETGEMTELASLSQCIRNIAADAQGQLWGIGRDGVLYKVALDGSLTKMLQTDWQPTSQEQGATIDVQTGKYIWAANAYKISSGSLDDVYTQLVEIDLNSLEVTVPWEFPLREQLTGLCIIDAHPDAPDNISDLSFKAKTLGGLDGQVSFTLPSKTYGQGALTGTLDVKVWIDNVEVDNSQMEAGSLYSLDHTMTESGFHTAKVVLNKDGRDGVTQTKKYYFGKDTPKAPSDVTLTTDADKNIAYLTWKPVTEGVNGGYVNPEELKYVVVRQPEAKTLETSLTEASFTETLTREMKLTRYDVKAVADGKTSSTTKSNTVRIGGGNALPYTNKFTSQSLFDQFFTIDNNGDGTDDFESPAWNWDDDYSAAFYYANTDGGSADDYLITPKLALDPSKTYHLRFKLYGEEGWENTLKVLIGNQPTVGGMSREVAHLTSYATQDNPEYRDIYFALHEGEQYVGLHNVSTVSGTNSTTDHMSITNFSVEEWGSAAVPDTLLNLHGGCTSGKKVQLSFQLPETTLMGETLTELLTVTIYRGTESAAIATLTDLEPGSSQTWTDENSTESLNTYRVVVSNSVGSSLEQKVSVDLTVEAPDAPTGVSAKYVDATDIEITWDKQGSGRYDPDAHAVTYNVYRGGVLIASGLENNTYIDADPAEQGTLELQQTVYSVSALNIGGESSQTKTSKMMIGKPYSLPFSETWEYQTQKTYPWFRESTSNCDWSVVSTGYDPYTLGQDGPGLIKCSLDENSSTAGTATLQTPTIDFSNCNLPHLSFYYYTSPDYSSYTNIQLMYNIEETGDTLLCNTRFYCQAETKGWKHIELDLPGLAGASRASIFFWGSIVGVSNSIHLDNVSIGEGSTEGISDIRYKNSCLKDNTYNLYGQPVGDNYKGIVIRNNRKTLK